MHSLQCYICALFVTLQFLIIAHSLCDVTFVFCGCHKLFNYDVILAVPTAVLCQLHHS